MRLIKCDRCEEIIVNPGFTVNATKIKCELFSINDAEIKYDLCDGCSIAFRDFMNPPKQEKEKENG